MVSIAYRAIIIQFFHKPESEAWINSNLETHRLEDYIPIFHANEHLKKENFISGKIDKCLRSKLIINRGL